LTISVTKITSELLGDIYAAQSSKGVCRLEFGGVTERRFLDMLAKDLGPEASFETRPLPIVEVQLKKYLAGQGTSFSLEVDIRGLTPFERSVLRQTMKIPYGKTASYGQIASRVGKPNEPYSHNHTLSSRDRIRRGPRRLRRWALLQEEAPVARGGHVGSRSRANVRTASAAGPKRSRVGQCTGARRRGPPGDPAARRDPDSRALS
jgi:O6-methylguanine-DNA--protein-cysteine methyltransferase